MVLKCKAVVKNLTTRSPFEILFREHKYNEEKLKSHIRLIVDCSGPRQLLTTLQDWCYICSPYALLLVLCITNSIDPFKRA